LKAGARPDGVSVTRAFDEPDLRRSRPHRWNHTYQGRREVVEEFDGCSRAKHFAVAKRIANAAQRKALAAEIAKRPKRR
jgi:hypothetical protein